MNKKIYDETNVPGPEYRVRPVIRYVITRYFHAYESTDGTHGMPGSCETIAEVANENLAEEIARRMRATTDQAMLDQS